MSTEAVLYDHPGPRARLRNRILTSSSASACSALLYWIYARFDAKGQWAASLWKPFTQASTWTDYILPGLLHTLAAAAVAMVAVAGLRHRLRRRPALRPLVAAHPGRRAWSSSSAPYRCCC